MAIEHIYVTDFIVPELHLAMINYENEDFKGFQSLVHSVTNKKVQLVITGETHEKFKSAKDNENDELILAALAKFLAWIDTSKVRPIKNEEVPEIDYKKNRIRKTTASVIAPCLLDEISAAIYNHEFDEDPIEQRKRDSIVQKLMISSEKLKEGKYEFLFKSQELQQFETDEMKAWHKNISKFSVPTKKVRIIDKYFIKNNKYISISDFVGSFLSKTPDRKLKVEIITDIDIAFGFNREKNKKMTSEWIKRASTDSTEIVIYHIKEKATEFHDRHLWTEYWNLQIQAGIDGKRNLTTNPILTGRYAENALSWKRIDEKWESWTQNECKNIRLIALS